MVEVLKLTTGELVIADVVREGDHTVTLKNPHLIAMTPQGTMLIPLAPLKENEEIELKKEFVMLSIDSTKLVPEIINTFNQKFGSGLTIASKLPEDEPKLGLVTDLDSERR